MKITVFLKLTADPARVLPEDWQDLSPEKDLGYAGREINCFDASALELALQIRDRGRQLGQEFFCQAVTAGDLPEAVAEQLYSAGYDRVVELKGGQREFSPKDTAELLAPYGRNSDLLLFGQQAGFGDTGMVPWRTAEALGLPLITGVESLTYDGSLHLTSRDGETLRAFTAEPPAAITVGNCLEVLRMPTLRQRLRVRGRLPEREDRTEKPKPYPVLKQPKTEKQCRMLDPEDPETYKFIHRLLASCGKPKGAEEDRALPEDCLAVDPGPWGPEDREIMRNAGKSLILLPDTQAGRALAIQTAADTGRACFFGASGLRRQGDRILVKKPCCGGNLLWEESLKLPAVVTVEDLSPYGEAQKLPQGEVPGFIRNLQILEEPGNLSRAQGVLIAGNGLGSLINCQQARKMSEDLASGFGLTRAALLNGWGTAGEVVGQSGRKLHCEICLTLGVSGAGPFLLGIRQAKTVIAVNLDPHALIFRQADYGICMDAKKFLEKLRKEE